MGDGLFRLSVACFEIGSGLFWWCIFFPFVLLGSCTLARLVIAFWHISPTRSPPRTLKAGKLGKEYRQILLFVSPTYWDTIHSESLKKLGK